ncbi:MAG TPA: pilus assembly protein PilB [Cyanobacteria bacterium UBA8803]|nr:pilus assembly protein PilB [Cyanobacteria bacterium UBA9273]HBL58625.1 pilus assembly protein PilB [Cyanobacteria bacterium UBA8803]
MDIEELLDNIYNAFNPQPLPAGDSKYVECREVRGDVEILQDLGRSIRRSRELTCQLYSGYRGTGKTTELLRLKADLEEQKCFVVYFAADEEDISVQDVQYADILLACTRHLLDKLKQANSQPIADWLRERLQDLKDILSTEINLNQLTIETQLNQFAKITAAIRAEPSQRQKIREKVEPHTETLLKALNAFIADAKHNLPDGKTQLVVIADNLDRIVPIFRDNGRSNHEEIFLDRHEQLKALDCHIVYTVPISMIYSRWATDLKDNYGISQVLPSVMVQYRDGSPYEAGIAKLKETIKRRVEPYTDLDLETQIFESPEVLEQLCRMSGGYMRDLIQLAQEAINRTDQLPISARAVQRAIAEVRDIYQRAVEENQWQTLAQVHKSKEIANDNLHRSLLFNRCLLEYRYLNQKGDKYIWYDVHPLIWELPKFKDALK